MNIHNHFSLFIIFVSPFFTTFVKDSSAESPRVGAGESGLFIKKTFIGVCLSYFKTSQLLACRIDE